MTGERYPRRKCWVKHLTGIGTTVLCLTVLFFKINFSEVLDAFANFHWVYLLLGISSLALGYALRIIRWSVMLKAAGSDATFVKCSAPFLGSIALNNVLPLRMGDVVRAFVFPKAMGLTKTTATSSLIVERLIDLLTLLISLAIGLFAIQAVEIPEDIKKLAVSLTIAGGGILASGFLFSGIIGRYFLDLAAIRKERTRDKYYHLCLTVGALLQSFEVMSRPRLLAVILSISMLIWIGEAGLFYFILLGVDIHGSFFVALLVMAIATLSTMAPSSPGYVGPFHLATFTAISLVGGTATQAGSYAVIVHLSLWLSTTIAGTIAILINPKLFREAKSQMA